MERPSPPALLATDDVTGRGVVSWCPTSKYELYEAEQKMLAAVKTPFKQGFVEVNGHQINTLYTLQNARDPHPNHETHPPLVLLHGFGAGIGFWCLNIDSLAQHYTVYAFDLLGFGRSSRPSSGTSDAHDTEQWWVRSIESWAAKMQLRDVVWVGHSFGAYLSACYALKYPQRIRKLILTDPVGVPQKNKDDVNMQMDWQWRLIMSAAWKLPLFTAVRAAGAFGPDLIKWARSDLCNQFPIYEDDRVLEYLYHLIAQEPSGETAFTKMFVPFAWAKKPLVDRLHVCQVRDITFLYGSESWMDPTPAFALRDKMRETHRVHILMIEGAGHHVYADRKDEFHAAVIAHKYE